MQKQIFNIFFALILFFSSANLCANDTLQIPSISRYVLWFSPSSATHTYGLNFRVFPNFDTLMFAQAPKIYGAELNIDPLSMLVTVAVATYVFFPNSHQPIADSITFNDYSKFKKIYGLQCGFLNIDPKQVLTYGLNINIGGSFGNVTKGIIISPLMNKSYLVDGITIGLVANHDVECNGIQIGLINSCRNLTGLQIGIWNINQDRSSPIINWSF